MMPDRFNIRVYMLILNQNSELLLSDEILAGRHCTKFPGGGLEFGEGTIDCAKREALEELGQSVEVMEHVYTTDFYLQSSFRKMDQVLSIYYRAELKGAPQFREAKKPFDFQSFEEGEESFRWKKLSEIELRELTFPADRKALEVFREVGRERGRRSIENR